VSRVTGKSSDVQEKTPLLPVDTSAYDAAMKKAARDQYACEQEQIEREEGWRDNPSVDPVTQKAIIMEYRALHEQFKVQGLYQCNYSAYAWESLRYLALFAAFGYFLHIKWYITSAMFLGLFWVSTDRSACESGQMLIAPCSNKSCSQLTTPATAALQETLFTTR
jgi:delta8-fatty-acid desaturase